MLDIIWCKFFHYVVSITLHPSNPTPFRSKTSAFEPIKWRQVSSQNPLHSPSFRSRDERLSGELVVCEKEFSVDLKTVPHKVLSKRDYMAIIDFQDHVNEVENKLTTIVMSVLERQLTKWEVKAPVPSPVFRNICKQITKFYDTVSSLLPTVSNLARLLPNLFKTAGSILGPSTYIALLKVPPSLL